MGKYKNRHITTIRWERCCKIENQRERQAEKEQLNRETGDLNDSLPNGNVSWQTGYNTSFPLRQYYYSNWEKKNRRRENNAKFHQRDITILCKFNKSLLLCKWRWNSLDSKCQNVTLYETWEPNNATVTVDFESCRWVEKFYLSDCVFDLQQHIFSGNQHGWMLWRPLGANGQSFVQWHQNPSVNRREAHGLFVPQSRKHRVISEEDLVYFV